MSTRGGDDKGPNRAGALTRVVEAEKLAAQRIAEAREGATRIVADAKQAARAEAERTDRRIQALHGCARKALKARAAAEEAAFRDEAAHAAQQASEAEVDALVARLARRMTGQSEGSAE